MFLFVFMTCSFSPTVPYTSYEIEVYGTTSKGDGEPSEIMGGLTDVTGEHPLKLKNIFYQPWRPMCYFQFEIIINVLVSSFCFI